MPIKPEHRHHYQAPEWDQLRARVFARAKNRCEKCGREHGSPYQNKKGKWVAVQLGCAHIDQNPANNADSNLAAWCRACHMEADLPWHVLHAADTRKTRKDAARPLLHQEAV